ncbi:MAG: hypothetical protein JWM52_308 [Candidatus Saccharibacteria bacterium]|nr:hypothetical protein [Candidatus Saccharibacteria bacterium]
MTPRGYLYYALLTRHGVRLLLRFETLPDNRCTFYNFLESLE